MIDENVVDRNNFAVCKRRTGKVQGRLERWVSLRDVDFSELNLQASYKQMIQMIANFLFSTTSSIIITQNKQFRAHLSRPLKRLFYCKRTFVGVISFF